MDQGLRGEVALTVAEEQSRRSALQRIGGGGLAALLGAMGLGADGDAGAAKSRCRKHCRKKNSRKKRRQCRKRCGRNHVLRQRGSAELVRLSPENCAELGTCRDSVFGVITGTPVTDGTFTGVMTGTNIRGDETSLTVDFSGTLIAAERIGADTIGAALALTMTQQRAPVGEPSPFTFSGTFVIAGGTGKFAGATGGGAISGDGVREFGGAEGTVESFSMDGTYRLKK